MIASLISLFPHRFGEILYAPFVSSQHTPTLECRSFIRWEKEQVFRPAVLSLAPLYCKIILNLAVLCCHTCRERTKNTRIFRGTALSERKKRRPEMKCFVHLTSTERRRCDDKTWFPFSPPRCCVTWYCQRSILVITLIEPSGNLLRTWLLLRFNKLSFPTLPPRLLYAVAPNDINMFYIMLFCYILGRRTRAQKM